MRLLISLFVQFLVVGLFLYSKLLPYKEKLDPKYNGLFKFVNAIFTPILNFLKTVFKPFQVGQGLAVDMTQIVLLLILLLIINFIH
jgi:hypothetical protein